MFLPNPQIITEIEKKKISKRDWVIKRNYHYIGFAV